MPKQTGTASKEVPTVAPAESKVVEEKKEVAVLDLKIRENKLFHSINGSPLDRRSAIPISTSTPDDLKEFGIKYITGTF